MESEVTDDGLHALGKGGVLHRAEPVPDVFSYSLNDDVIEGIRLYQAGHTMANARGILGVVRAY